MAGCDKEKKCIERQATAFLCRAVLERYSRLGEGAIMQARLILFDCDGTLMNSHHHIIAVMQASFAECGFAVPTRETVLPVIGLSLGLAVQRLLPDEEPDVAARITERYRELYHTMPADYCLFESVRETLEALLQRGYWLGVVTGKSHAGLQQVLDEFELHRYFLVTRTADQCPSKPHPAMVMECMAEMGVGAGQTCVIGDALLDIQMARAGGVRALGVSFGVADSESLLETGAAHVVDRFSDLLAHFPHLQAGQSSSTIRR